LPLRESYYTHRRAVIQWANPSDPETYTAAWARASQWRGLNDVDEVTDALADIASHCGLPSGLAARDALVYYAGRYFGYEVTDDTEQALARYIRDMLRWPVGSLNSMGDDQNRASGYIRPEAGEPPNHPDDCDCQTCSPCTCNEPHCENCHPDGVPEWCRCRLCRPAVMDDESDDDDWPGLPAIPDPVPGRCRFGIEVEFNDGERSTIATRVQEAGIACTAVGYGHEITRFWRMTTDSTVSGGELVSPIMSGDDLSIEQVRHAIRIVKEHGGTTGRNVGMHVHLDVTPFHTPELKALAYNLQRAQDCFAAFVPVHRYDGSIGCGAELIDPCEWDSIHNWLDGVDPANRRRTNDNREESCPIQRYVSFNFNSLLTYGTIECRLLGHTLNTIKVRTWIRALQALVEVSRQELEVDGDVLNFLTEFGGLESEHADHFRAVATRRGNEHMLAAV
jgi:hypothetical protein